MVSENCKHGIKKELQKTCRSLAYPLAFLHTFFWLICSILLISFFPHIFYIYYIYVCILFFLLLISTSFLFI